MSALTGSFKGGIICCCFTLLILMQSKAAPADQYARFSYQNEIHYGRVDGDQFQILTGGLFPVTQDSGQTVGVNEVEYLPPTEASKIFAVGMNFASHRSSRASAPPPLFVKLPSSLTGHNTRVELPPDAEDVHYEGEMVLVIGKKAKNVSLENAGEYIFGITAGNDISERIWQRKDLQWLRGKASDGFGPVGPFIDTTLDPGNVVITTTVNGKIVQQENTANMIHSVEKVVSYVSRYFTLEPGDLIYMGTPGRTRALTNGDVVTVDVQNTITLSNQISQ